jgi:hypothetical protein
MCTPVEADAPADAPDGWKLSAETVAAVAAWRLRAVEVERDVMERENDTLRARVSQLEATVAEIRVIAKAAEYTGLAHLPLDRIRAVLHATPERPEADAVDPDPARSIPQAVDVEALITQLAAEHTARLAAEQRVQELEEQLKNAGG